jgi:glycosyltransferase involved in cell wall biosynthesis
LACGTPVVAFDATGPKDIVAHKKTGWLAEPYRYDKLAEGITWTLSEGRSEELAKSAREQAVARYEETLIAESYLDVYEAIL